MPKSYYVIDSATFRTIAICNDQTTATWICDNYPAECYVKLSL